MSPATTFKENSPRTSSHLPPVLICYIKPDEKTFRNTWKLIYNKQHLPNTVKQKTVVSVQEKKQSKTSMQEKE
jgi:hypothetical protein